VTVSVPILMYHEVTPRPLPAFRKYSITPDELSAQLQWLRRAGYATVNMDAVCSAWRGERELPARAVAITFDDGLRDCVEHAVPVLAAHGFTATFYIVAGLVGMTSQWLLAERGFEFPMADWAMLRAAEDAEMYCESHTVSHPRLAKLSPAACREELALSRKLLEDGLGRSVRHLAYPFGSFSPEVRDIAGEMGYTTACTVVEALASPPDDLLALPRVPVIGGEGMRDFESRLRTAQAAPGLLRAAATAIARRIGIGSSATGSAS
jgi:peptidoglycan/xylan/chitin deacetylase (PgdA/CDA1 family)